MQYNTVTYSHTVWMEGEPTCSLPVGSTRARIASPFFWINTSDGVPESKLQAGGWSQGKIPLLKQEDGVSHVATQQRMESVTVTFIGWHSWVSGTLSWLLE